MIQQIVNTIVLGTVVGIIVGIIAVFVYRHWYQSTTKSGGDSLNK